MSTIPGTTGKGTPRKRVLEACVFCRRRKIRCSSERPACNNCKTYGNECEYPPGNRRSRIHRREHPNPTRPQSGIDKALLVSGDKPVDPEASDNGTGAESDDLPCESEQPQGVTERPVSRIFLSDTGTASYHGQTSALFEESLQKRGRVRAAPVGPEWIEKGLVAEAALQRQMEVINYSTGKLDFDGVDPELGMHLLTLHWNRQHHSFLITYRPAFMRDMACNGPYFSKLLLNAIYYGSSKFSPRLEVRRNPSDVRTAGWMFRQRVRDLLGNALDGSEITTIQALLVMANSLFALGDERSAAWLYSGLAFRMIIDLGMHVEAPALSAMRALTDEDLEVRRRVFWGAFVVDKIMSLYQGRPVSLQEVDSDVPLSFLDKFEENENWTPFAYGSDGRKSYLGCPAYSVSTFQALCSLSVIMNKILNTIYAERIFDRSSSDLSQILEDLQAKLDNWNNSLAPHLQFDPLKDTSTPPPHVLSLLSMYNVLLILLHRPFVADGHLHNTARSISVNSLIICASAANQIVRLLRAYDKAFSVRRAPYLISYATYVSATIHVRIAAKRNQNSEAHKRLQTCLAILGLNQETNWAARRAKVVVEGLMKRLGINRPANEDVLPTSDIAEGRAHEHAIGDDASINITSSAVESGPDGFSPGLDIDAVIQSFVPQRQHGNFSIPFISESYQISHHTRQAPDMSFGAATPMYSGPTGLQEGENQHNEDWLGSSTFQDSTIDDILFGFNGAMLDDIFMANDA